MNDDPSRSRASRAIEAVERICTNGPRIARTARRPRPNVETCRAKAKAEENYNKFLYAMADFENYKKRVERQLGEISLAGKKSVLKKILPVLDNLERALTSTTRAAKVCAADSPRRCAASSRCSKAKASKPMPLKGARFDPKFAEAIGTRAAPETFPKTPSSTKPRGHT